MLFRSARTATLSAVARGAPSAADLTLIAHSAAHGLPVTPTQLERWRSAGLLPVNRRRYTGRGSSSTPPPEAFEMVLWLARNASVGRRPNDLALLAFADGMPIPEPRVRKAFAAAIDAATVVAETKVDRLAYGSDEEWAEAVAEQVIDTGEYPTVLPERIRRIDRGVSQTGAAWTGPTVAAFDGGPLSDEPLTAADASFNAVTTTLRGREGINEQDLADLVRAVSPAAAPNPVASMIEHDQLDHDDGLGPLIGIPNGDIRGQLHTLLSALSLAELAAAFRAQRAGRAWANEICTAVETELTAGLDGPATTQWRTFTQLGLPRFLLVTALKTADPSPTEEANAALALAFVTSTMRHLDAEVPGMQWELLPAFMPPWLLDLVQGGLQQGGAA
jgi:hypothetical protein